MHNTEQTLGTAIAELHCLSPDRPASLAELTALSTARECIDQLLSSCVTELRTDPQITHSWPAIAYALGSPSVNATRQKYGVELTKTEIAGTGVEHLVKGNGHVRAFWNAFADRFTWNFLPVDFVHALYVHWMSTTFPEEGSLGRAAFTGRLKGWPPRPRQHAGTTPVSGLRRCSANPSRSSTSCLSGRLHLSRRPSTASAAASR